MTELMAHCDTKKITEAEVKAIPAPEFTKTWHPVSHGRVIESLEVACSNRGIGIKNRQYSTNKEGSQMFGTWALDLGTRETGYALGFRNATNKTMGIGICAGTNVLVCDNMCFSGEYIKFRKHTAGLDFAELTSISEEAISGSIIEMEKMVTWQDSLHEVWVPQVNRKAFVYDLMAENVISPAKMNRYLKCVEEEKAIHRGRSLDGAHSLYNLHGATTRLMRDWNLLRVSEASSKLNEICDNYMIKLAA